MTTWYHGSPNLFYEFDYNRIRTNGTSEGVGFYFTDKRSIANSYADGGYIYEVKLHGKKPLYEDKKTITIAELRTYLQALHEHTDFLSNYGDVDYEGYAKVLERAVCSQYTHCETDADIIGSLYNATGENAKVLTVLYETLGYDHIIAKPKWGNHQKLNIALVNDIIEIIHIHDLTYEND